MNFSIDQLEQKFDDAVKQGRKKELKLLAEELKNRRVPRAKELAKAVLDSLSASKAKATAVTVTEAPKPATKPKHPPTSEQATAIDYFKSGQSLKINAYAGAGKTSTLEMLAHSRPGKQGQYIAFNRDIVKDAKDKFPASVNCATTHGIAFRSVASQYNGNGEKLTGKINANQLCEILGLKTRWRIDELHSLAPRSQGFLILETIKRFARSGDAEFISTHVPHHGSLISAPPQALQAVSEFALKGARNVWARMTNPGDTMPLGHDGYLKLWALSNPRFLVDFVLLDEAQDTNEVVLGVLKNQDAQMIYVGDRYQQIYEWRGAVNAMETIDTERTAYLSTSFRFGPELAQAASMVLHRLGESVDIKGNPALSTRLTAASNKKTIVSRTNSSTISELIRALDQGKKPHLVAGADDMMSMLRGVQDLKGGQPSSVPDFFGFNDWKEVQEFAKSREGEHLMTFVNLVDSRSEKQLMWALNRSVEPDKADIVISTTHKAKGREWPSVQLTDDFVKVDPKTKQVSAEELRLLYVAMTRAQKELELPETIQKFLKQPYTAKPSTQGAAESNRTAPTNWQRPTSRPLTQTPKNPPERTGFFSRLFDRT